MIKNTKKGFTLIELLVVITIIWILATGAIWVFTTQLQWARDAMRISDMKIMETALHQLFNDNAQYPAFTNSWAFKTVISPFVSKELKDSRIWDSICWETDTTRGLCGWFYNSRDDTFGLPFGAFKLWVKFEKKTNFDNKANSTHDGWTIDSMFEIFNWAWWSWITLPVGNLVY